MRSEAKRLAGFLLALLCLLRQVTPAQAASEYAPPYTVYSVNAVGFINITVPSGYSLVSAQLFNHAQATDPLQTTVPNAIPNLFIQARPSSFGVTKIRSNGRFGTAYFTPGIGWTETDMMLLPGEGAVLWNPGGTLTNTIVGSVLDGALTNELPAGLCLCSSSVPQGGRLTSDLAFPAAFGDAVFFLNPDGSYRRYDYWATGWHPEEPVARVAEAFWSYKLASVRWVRLFSVNGFYYPITSAYSIRTFAAGPEVTTNNLHRAIPYLPVMPGQLRAGLTRSLQLRASAVNQVVADYQWQKNGVALTDGLRLAGAQSDTLVLTDLQRGVDDGVYTVTATNSAGRIVAHAASLEVVSAATVAPSFDHPVKTASTVEHILRVEPGAFYRVQTSPDLHAWTEVTNFTSAGSIFQLSLPAPTNGVRLFYRLASP